MTNKPETFLSFGPQSWPWIFEINYAKIVALIVYISRSIVSGSMMDASILFLVLIAVFPNCMQHFYFPKLFEK